MKKLLYILLLLFNSNLFLAQNDTLRNAFELEIGGKGKYYSLNYWRKIIGGDKNSLVISMGFSYDFICEEYNKYKLPIDIGYLKHFGKTSSTAFGIGIGVVPAFIPSGENMSFKDYVYNENPYSYFVDSLGNIYPRGSTSYSSYSPKYYYDYFISLKLRFRVINRFTIAASGYLFYKNGIYQNNSMDLYYGTKVIFRPSISLFRYF